MKAKSRNRKQEEKRSPLSSIPPPQPKEEQSETAMQRRNRKKQEERWDKLARLASKVAMEQTKDMTSSPPSIVDTKNRSSDSISELVAPFLRNKSYETITDLMQVNITLYGLYGIVGVKEQTNKRRTRPNKREWRKKAMQKSIKPSGMGPSQDLTESVESFDLSVSDLNVPVTAVVSCRRNASSSVTMMETFLPSSPLKFISNPDIKANRYKARWIEEDGTDKDFSETDLFTLKLLKAMKRECYRPGVQIQDVCNYANETVDLQVYIGRGTSLIHVGVASLVITGDEEGEVIINIPAKPIDTPQQDVLENGHRGTRKKGMWKPVFPNNPNKHFSLGQNAFLRVGVRVSPYQKLESPRKTEAVRENKFSKSRTKAGNIIVELEDENSLIAKLLGANGGDTIDDRQCNNNVEEANHKVEPLSPKVNTIGCCNSPWHMVSDVFPFLGHVIEKKRCQRHETKISSNQKPEEAVILPSSFLSSVSESTDLSSIDITSATANSEQDYEYVGPENKEAEKATNLDHNKKMELAQDKNDALKKDVGFDSSRYRRAGKLI